MASSMKLLPLYLQNRSSYLALLTRSHTFLGRIPEEDQTDELYQIALSKCEDGDALRYMRNPSDAQIMQAIQQDGMAIRHVKKDRQTESLCLLALNCGTRGTGIILSGIKNQTYEICLRAAMLDPRSLQCCKFQDDLIVTTCLEKIPHLLTYAKGVHENLCLKFLKEFDHFAFHHLCSMKRHYSYSFYCQYVDINGDLLEHVPKEIIDYDLCLRSVKNKWSALEFVPSCFLSEEIILAGYDQDPRAIQFLCPTIDESLLLPLKIQREMECSLHQYAHSQVKQNHNTSLRRIDCL